MDIKSIHYGFGCIVLLQHKSRMRILLGLAHLTLSSHLVNRDAFGRSDDADVMFLSRTNNSLQQHVSSSDSSSLIGPR
jgi:hypothetical protein